MTFVSSVHNPKIMLGMLIKVLCSHSIATRRRLPREGNVTFEDLMRGTTDFDVRTVTIEGLTSVRYLLSGTVGIVTVSAAIWSPGLSWSHDTLHFDERVDGYPVRAYRNTSVAESEGVASLLRTAASSFAPAR
jgi:hypothetical protein